MDKSAIGVKRKVINNNLNISRYLDSKIILFSIMGFLISRSVLIGSIAPLGLAMFLCLLKSKIYRVPVFISILFGILFSSNTMPYTIKYIVCLSIFMFISGKLKKIQSIEKLALIGVMVIMPISIGQAIFSDNYMYEILLGAMEASILFISTYIFSFGVDLIINTDKRLYVNVEESISISLIIAFSIMGIGSTEILGISVTTVLSTVVILVGI